MKSINRLIVSLAAVLLFSGVAMALPTVAHGESASDSSANSTTSSSTDSQTKSEGQSLAQQYRDMVKAQLQTDRANHKTQTEQHRQMACEARKANLTTRMNNAVSFATTHKAVFDKIYTRVQTFYTSKNLNVSNYSSLKAAVDTAQANAQAQINALSTLKVNIDCTSQTVADSISAFQQAIGSTRDSLKAYRSALVNLITAFKGASTASPDSQPKANSGSQ